MSRLIILVLLSFGWALSSPSLFAGEQSLPPKLSELAKAIAETELASLAAKRGPAAARFRVGVFTFANRNGQQSSNEMGDLGQLFQEGVEKHLPAALTKSAPGWYRVVSAFPGLKISFENIRENPASIHQGGDAGAYALMRKLKIDVGVIGRFDFVRLKSLRDASPRPQQVKLTIRVLFPWGSKTIVKQIPTADLLALPQSKGITVAAGDFVIQMTDCAGGRSLYTAYEVASKFQIVPSQTIGPLPQQSFFLREFQEELTALYPIENGKLPGKLFQSGTPFSAGALMGKRGAVFVVKGQWRQTNDGREFIIPKNGCTACLLGKPVTFQSTKGRSWSRFR